VGKRFLARIDQGEVNNVTSNAIFSGIPKPSNDRYCEAIAHAHGNPFSDYSLRKLFAERDIVSEQQSNSNSVVRETGAGATQMIQSFLNHSHRDRSVVEEKLLRALNEIFNPDSNFERITTRLEENTNRWEIYLYESRKGGWVPLSKSGSGLKTIILVLINLFLVPVIEKKPNLKRYIFAFEELENNLHPALQKRLFEYLYRKAIEEKTCFIFTTHSNVVIDLFANKEDAQLLHVKHDGEVASVHRVDSYSSKKDILNDLEFRASDLLQSNGIVWVEGPSDRTYFNKWVEVYSNGTLREGIHYQCVIYGGALKSHLSAEDPTQVDKAIAVFNVNRNAILLTDSDKDTARSRLKKTVTRLREEFEKWDDSFFFITEGREVENYIPASAAQEVFGVPSIREIEKFEKADKYLTHLRRKTGQKSLNKLQLAEKVTPALSRENLDTVPSLKSDMKKVVALIESWNQQGSE
jgi:predicted ATP-dependent endonuclease of OLD family